MREAWLTEQKTNGMNGLKITYANVDEVLIENNNGKKQDVVMVYMPPLIRTWSPQEYEIIMSDVIEVLARNVRSNFLLLVGDFYCKRLECNGSWGKQKIMV